jgi:hypothetical protein
MADVLVALAEAGEVLRLRNSQPGW